MVGSGDAEHLVAAEQTAGGRDRAAPSPAGGWKPRTQDSSLSSSPAAWAAPAELPMEQPATRSV